MSVVRVGDDDDDEMNYQPEEVHDANEPKSPKNKKSKLSDFLQVSTKMNQREKMY